MLTTMRSVRYVAVCLAVVAAVATSPAVAQTTKTVVNGNTKTTYTYDNEGNVVSWFSETSAGDQPVNATPNASVNTVTSTVPSSAPPASSSAPPASSSAPPASISSTDGGPMTINTNAPQTSDTQSPRTTQPATTAPQPTRTRRPPPPPQPTQAPQPPQPVQTPQQTPAPQPTQAPQPAVTQATPAPQAPQQPSPTPTPTLDNNNNNNDKKDTNSPTATTSQTPAATNGNGNNGGAQTTKPTSPTPTTIPVGTVSAGGADKSESPSTSPSSKTASSTSSSSSSADTKPLSENDGNLTNANRGSGGGSAWGTIVAVAGVICVLVGAAAFTIVNRRRNESLNESKNVDDFASCSQTPMDAVQPKPAAAIPPARAMPSPERTSYDFTRASAAVPRAAPSARPMAAMPTPIDTTAMNRPVTRQHPQPGMTMVGPSNGSILQARESTASSVSHRSSDASFVSSASVAPPIQTSGFEEALNASAGFKPTPSFVLKTANKPTSNSIASSNMEYEFGDDSTVQVVGGPAPRGTIVRPSQRIRRNTLSSSAMAAITANSIFAAKVGSYDSENDVLSEDGDVDDVDVDVDESSDNQHPSFAIQVDEEEPEEITPTNEGTQYMDAEDLSLTQSFYEPRDDSYSDDYARASAADSYTDDYPRGSSADSAIRTSTDSLFSRSSSEFGGRNTDDSYA